MVSTLILTVASMIKGAVGVLYPDMSKMTTFEARY
jgi:hypothetical protein